MRQQGPAQIQLPLHFLLQTMFQVLCDDLAEDYLLGEVLRTYTNAPIAYGPQRQRSDQRDHERQSRDNFRSTHPNPQSAASAINAAGTAPARICAVSTDATPRKIKTPSPPPPMAAAIVAVPMVVTVATRIPARMVGAASGSCTWRSICPLVIPMATADSQTAASTLAIPTNVLRKMGSSAYIT